MNRMGQFDHVDFHGKQIKCRSNCEDQSNEMFVTASKYPNRGVFVMRPEFCLVMLRLLGIIHKRYQILASSSFTTF